jgi:SpoVK/Ycf46/Vps4 family AAA+-type ATPase
MLAGALAHWVGELSGSGESKWISVRPGELRSEWYGVAERRVRECFQAARTAGALDARLPVVLFFDEIDSIASTRGHFGGNVDDRVMQAFAAELDGVVGRGNILVIGATNRRQALDPALLRPGRFGDKSITVPRPNMSAARAILEKQLPTQVPYYLNGHGSDVDAARADLIAATVSRLYAPNASASLGKLVFRDASVREVKASDLISGANLANITRAARERACWREVAGEDCGLRLDDALAAIDQELDSLARVLTPRNVRDHIAGLPDDLDVIRIERPPTPRSRAVHQYLTLS